MRRFKITPEQVEEIRRRVAAGESQASVAKDYGVAQGTISRIWLNLRGPGSRTKPKEPDRQLDAAQIRRLREAWLDGVSESDLAGRFDAPRRVVIFHTQDLTRESAA